MSAETSHDRPDTMGVGEFAVNCNGLTHPAPAWPWSDNCPISSAIDAETYGWALADPLVATYCLAARAENTNRAYAADLQDFQRWGGNLPSSPTEVAHYLATRAQSLKPSSLRRRMAALATAHNDLGAVDPTKHGLVRRVMRGIERTHGTSPRQVAPLLIEDLRRIVAAMGDCLSDTRDKALLLVGFFGALRRSEIVSLMCEDLAFSNAGLTIHIRKSKTDHAGRGRLAHLHSADERLNPGLALRNWLTRANLSSGPIFPGAHGAMRLNDRAVARVVKKWITAVSLNPQEYSGHSLRAGFTTSAVRAGFNTILVARQTGHKSLQTLSAYVRAGAGGSQFPL